MSTINPLTEEEQARLEGPTDEAFREIGFTGAARNYRRSSEAQQAFGAWFGALPKGHVFPETFKFAPNETALAAWERVGALIRAERERADKAEETGWKAAFDAILYCCANWFQDARSEGTKASYDVICERMAEMLEEDRSHFLHQPWKDAQSAIKATARAEDEVVRLRGEVAQCAMELEEAAEALEPLARAAMSLDSFTNPDPDTRQWPSDVRMPTVRHLRTARAVYDKLKGGAR